MAAFVGFNSIADDDQIRYAAHLLLSITGRPGLPATGFSVYETGIDVLASFGARAPAALAQNVFTGVLPDSYAFKLFEKIICDPVLIDAGLIVETEDHSVRAWNTHQGISIDLTDINGINTEGTALYMAFPTVIPATWEAVGQLTIFKDGPPQQDTSYFLTLTDLLHSVEITGLRVVAISSEPDWTYGMTIKYKHHTVVATNKRLLEQRRPLLPEATREMQVAYQEYNTNAQALTNQAAYDYNRFFAVPVYSEKIYADIINTGAGYIEAVNDIEKFWNLQNQCSMVLIVEHDHGTCEVKEIDSISGNTIYFKNNITGVFVPALTAIYPVFQGILQSVNIRQASETADLYDFIFAEYK